MTDDLKQCDCCAAMVRTLHRCFAYGIETYACAKCRGLDECERCCGDGQLVTCIDTLITCDECGGRGEVDPVNEEAEA
jgi:hypothetical protein